MPDRGLSLKIERLSLRSLSISRLWATKWRSPESEYLLACEDGDAPGARTLIEVIVGADLNEKAEADCFCTNVLGVGGRDRLPSVTIGGLFMLFILSMAGGAVNSS